MHEFSEPHPGSREERIAYNQAWARDLNERKAAWMDEGVVTARFRCECWRADCDVRIGLTEREWQDVRSDPKRFAVAPDHLAVEVEAGGPQGPHLLVLGKKGGGRGAGPRTS